MQFRTYLWLMAIGSCLAWAGWAYVLFEIDPTEAGWLALLLFYGTLFVSLVGTFATFGVLYRVLRHHQELMSRQVKTSFRHAVMVALLTVVSLGLSALGLLYWWNFIALLIIFVAIEYGFLLVHESRRS